MLNGKNLDQVCAGPQPHGNTLYPLRETVSVVKRLRSRKNAGGPAVHPNARKRRRQQACAATADNGAAPEPGHPAVAADDGHEVTVSAEAGVQQLARDRVQVRARELLGAQQSSRRLPSSSTVCQL